MNKYIAFFAAAIVAAGASAQTLNVDYKGTIYNFNSATTGSMVFANGALDIQGKSFELSSLTGMKVVTDEAIADNLVMVEYQGTAATVTVAGNIARYIDATISGAYVTITQSEEVGDDTCGEITYRLSGATTAGSFVLNGGYKASIELNGVDITSASGAAIDIQNGKRTAIRVTEGTTNTLCDAAGGSQKAALYCKGHLEFKQKGSLKVTGKTAHAISAKEYIEIKNTKITIDGAAKDGLNCNQYFFMESGSLAISGVADDAIQTSYKDDTDREAEDTGTITIKAGTIDVTTTAAAAKGLKADGDIVINGGEITANIKGIALWDSTNKKVKAAAGLSADGAITINGGTLNLTATGGGGKGITCDGKFTTTGGNITIKTSGGLAVYSGSTLNQSYTGNADNINSDYKSSAKGIKCDDDIVIGGGTFDITTKGVNAEGIESKKTLTINDGTIKIRAYDDGTNSSSHTYINGGDMEIITLKGDAVDSNGNIYVNGGYFRIFGAASPEQGFDAGDGCKIYFTGGTFLSAGGGNSSPSTTTGSTQAYILPSVTLSANAVVTVKTSAGEQIATFTIPSDYGATSFSAPAMGPGGNRPGGNGGSSVILSCPAMVSGQTYTVTVGTTTTTAAARLTGGTTSI